MSLLPSCDWERHIRFNLLGLDDLQWHVNRRHRNYGYDRPCSHWGGSPTEEVTNGKCHTQTSNIERVGAMRVRRKV